MNASEREEGEISDEESEFENISDDSLSPDKSGKCPLATQELTPACISLSSGTDDRSEDKEDHSSKCNRRRSSREKCEKRVCRRRELARKKREQERTGRSSKRKRAVSDSDSDLEARRLKRQLKEAVRVPAKKTLEPSAVNLQKRLQRMINPNFSSTKLAPFEDEELLALRDIALLSTQKKEEEEIVQKAPAGADGKAVNASTDQELTELRITALKSAFINKAKNRKQQKKEDPVENVADIPVPPDDPLEMPPVNTRKVNSPKTVEKDNLDFRVANIEPLVKVAIEPAERLNSAIIQNSVPGKPLLVNKPLVLISGRFVEEPVQASKPFEKEGIKKGNEENIEEDEDIMRAMLLASMSKKITSEPLEPKTISKKILTDNVNSVNKKVRNSKLVTVMPKAPMRTIIIKVNSESDSDTEPSSPKTVESSPSKINTDENFDKKVSLLLKQARANVEKNEDTTLDKSVVKLLPRSQQAEYKQLKRKLQILKARKKNAMAQKIRRNSMHEIVNNIKKNVTPLTAKKIVKSKPVKALVVPVNKPLTSNAVPSAAVSKSKVEAPIIAVNKPLTSNAIPAALPTKKVEATVVVVNKPLINNAVPAVITKNKVDAPITAVNKPLTSNSVPVVLPKNKVEATTVAVNKPSTSNAAPAALPKKKVEATTVAVNKPLTGNAVPVVIPKNKVEAPNIAVNKPLTSNAIPAAVPKKKVEAPIAAVNKPLTGNAVPVVIPKNKVEQPNIVVNKPLTSSAVPAALPKKKVEAAVAAVNKPLTSNVIPVALPKKKVEATIIAVQDNRSQEKNKYEELEPLMRQIDEVKKKRDEEQLIVQNLLTQLKVARNRLSSVHQDFTGLVQKLVSAKADIDKCTAQSCNAESGTAEKNKLLLPKALCSSTPNKAPIKVAESNEPPLELSIIEADVQKDDDLRADEIDHEIVPVEKSTFWPYLSPLANWNRGTYDPFSVLCPYELQGVCRDTECKFQHYSSSGSTS